MKRPCPLKLRGAGPGLGSCTLLRYDTSHDSYAWDSRELAFPTLSESMWSSGTVHHSKSGWSEKGVTDNFLRPRPLERWKTSLLENTCFFPITNYKQSNSEKISITMKIDVRKIRQQANKVRNYKTPRK